MEGCKPGTIRMSASAASASPYGAVIRRPAGARIGPGSAAQSKKRYHGTPSSGRSIAKTSVAMPSSRGSTLS